MTISIQANSFSSSFILGTTIYRNEIGICNKIIAQVSYALIIPVALVESVAALAFSALSLLALPFSTTPLRNSFECFNSSAFSLCWAFVDFFLNPFMATLVADEKSARRILESRNFMVLPHGAIV